MSISYVAIDLIGDRRKLVSRVRGDRGRERERFLGRLPRLSEENQDAQSEIGEPEADAGRDIHFSFGGFGGDKSVSDIKKVSFHMRVQRVQI